MPTRAKDTETPGAADEATPEGGASQASTDDAVTTDNDPVSCAIQSWMEDHIFNGPIARSAESLAHLQSALPALKEKILKEI